MPICETTAFYSIVRKRIVESNQEILILQYAERLPIGLESVIRGVPAETVKAFYDRWYRPENMALVRAAQNPIENLDISLL